ncbi:hypothetical protein [Pandoraea pulmonicola]|uniref:Lipoprotein n=1 Tax=Pandoraea pulmonicola TaxID=93221 RepID=A0AAJ5D049_PANPU|nr:hypothetical protein [Pandoraea pulmonicola]AJC20982.1 hypothetical protein RO07_11790 [Pandoraea pulmonicola]SUA90411.1 Uncharacterised protein [Pandoraea pulmonicola]
MRISIFHLLAICTGLAVQATAFAYDCNDSAAYQSGQRELALVRSAVTAQMGWAVEFVQKEKGVSFDAALREVMQAGGLDQTRLYDDQLDELGAKIKNAKHDSPQACEALLLLQRQYAYIGQQKMDFVAKLVTGEDAATR